MMGRKREKGKYFVDIQKVELSLLNNMFSKLNDLVKDLPAQHFVSQSIDARVEIHAVAQ